MGPQGEKKMKKTLFAAIALAIATMPLTFAAQAPKVASPAGTSASQTAPKSTKTHTKKSTKKSTKSSAVSKTAKPVSAGSK